MVIHTRPSQGSSKVNVAGQLDYFFSAPPLQVSVHPGRRITTAANGTARHPHTNFRVAQQLEFAVRRFYREPAGGRLPLEIENQYLTQACLDASG